VLANEVQRMICVAIPPEKEGHWNNDKLPTPKPNRQKEIKCKQMNKMYTHYNNKILPWNTIQPIRCLLSKHPLGLINKIHVYKN
jgi:hypothetical protein